MTVVIVQCRLSSTRLPGKALKDLGGKPILAWTLAAMHEVPADRYFVATDIESETMLRPIVEQCGWELFSGPLDDVLERFCMVIEKTKADIVVRATADNPFLFYEAASALLDEYKRRARVSVCDYITWDGLPHGSGIEILNAASLLRARTLTELPYDHEHVGPALYNHTDIFTPYVVAAPSRWNYPSFRTTIDTPADYRHALQIVKFLSKNKAPSKPYTTEKILSALENSAVMYPVLLIPSTKKGQGTGHLRRCLSVATEIGAFVYIPENPELSETSRLIEESPELSAWQIVHDKPEKGEYSLVVTDLFSTDEITAKELYETGPVASIDEGSQNTSYADYLIDVIPSHRLGRKPNIIAPYFISLPQKKHAPSHAATSDDIKNILVVAGGEDPSDLVIPAAIAFAIPGKTVTAICTKRDEAAKRIPEDKAGRIRLIDPIPDLKEQLSSFDLIVTHYGFTAFEAVAAGCAVILMGTTPLHTALSEKYGFVCLQPKELTERFVRKILERTEKLYPESIEKRFPGNEKEEKSLGSFIVDLSRGRRLSCPVCHTDSFPDPIMARTKDQTFRRCAKCGTIYVSWTKDPAEKDYGISYFSEAYKRQYGKTYLEDFATIKTQCVRRTSIIDLLYRRRFHASVTPTVLDIGCAYGPFLDAAADSGWQVFGTDICRDAVDYVQKTLLFPAVCADFPDFDPSREFGIRSFDAVTMWYVIEHFIDLDAVLKTVSAILKKGGIFAFSTPSASGVSAKFNTESFFENSPTDHYTLFEPAKVKNMLKQYGFNVVKIVSTGHHPERFPSVRKRKWPVRSAPYELFSAVSHFFRLGDTFEVYCKKEKDL